MLFPTEGVPKQYHLLFICHLSWLNHPVFLQGLILVEQGTKLKAFCPLHIKQDHITPTEFWLCIRTYCGLKPLQTWSFVKSLKTNILIISFTELAQSMKEKNHQVRNRKINPGKIREKPKIIQDIYPRADFFCTIRCCAQNKNLRISLKAENKALLQPYICEFWNKGLFVCLITLCPWKQTLTWKTFQGNTLNQHPGINLQNAIQAWLSLEWMQAAYE